MMWDKVSWLFFWVCLVLWFGNMFGCASTQREPFVAEPAPARERQVELVWDVTPDGSHLVYAQDAAPEAAAAEPAAPAPTPAEPMSDTQPSVLTNSLDRSHWPKITVGAKSGPTTHYPFYFRDCPIADRDLPKINFNDPQEKQLEAALAGYEDGGWDCHHWMQVPVMPLKFGVDIVACPVYMCMNPPWSSNTTP